MERNDCIDILYIPKAGKKKRGYGFADTWAHQNFTGYYDAFNAMKGPLNRAFPRIGNAGAGKRPDRVDHFWHFHRYTTICSGGY
ncbi:DUF6765 family protein [Anoxynatronum sibiricum]|uniref:DUF6765 family protein n=1 Tax=Anoxynatronum sibiricum TaxID=210623 RepID=A0ABU9VVG8_9CLOT